MSDSNNWNEKFTCPASSAAGDAVYLTGNQTVALADNSSVSKYAIGVIAYKPTSTTGYVAFKSKVVSGLSGYVAGTKYYLSNSATAGNTLSTTESAQLVAIGISDTEILIVLESGVAWDIIKVPLNSTKAGTTNAPDFINIAGNIYTWGFAASTLEQLFLVVELPSSYKEGSSVYPQINWAPSDTGTGVVRWGLEYTVAKSGSDYGAPTTIYVEQAASGYTNRHQTAQFSAIDMTGEDITSVIICRLFRDATNANDTYTVDAFGIDIQFYFQKDTRGSSQRNTK